MVSKTFFNLCIPFKVKNFCNFKRYFKKKLKLKKCCKHPKLINSANVQIKNNTKFISLETYLFYPSDFNILLFVCLRLLILKVK